MVFGRIGLRGGKQNFLAFSEVGDGGYYNSSLRSCSIDY
jgi:hypothetical protein